MSFEKWYEAQKKKKKKETSQFESWYNQQKNNAHSGGGGSFAKDDDIAPVFKADANIKNNAHGGSSGSFAEDNTEDPTWFQAGAFSDGYQFGDVSKTILGTVTDVSENITTAVVDATENLIDTGAYIVGAVGGLFNEDFKDDVGDFIGKEILAPTQAGEVITKYANPAVGWLNQWINGGETEENSLLGDKADGLVQSASHLAGSYALQIVGVPTWLTQGVNAFGSETESAFQQGATFEEAGISGGISAAAEIIFEKISSGIKFKGGTVDEGFKKWLTKNISDKIGRTIINYGTDVLAEGGEEVLTEGVSALGRKLTYASDKEWEELFSSEDAFDAFIGGAVMSGVAGGGRIVKSVSDGTDYTSSLTSNEEKVVNKLYEDALTEKQKDGTKLSKSEKNKLWDSIVEDMSKGQIKVDDIESALGGDTYKSYTDATKKNTELKAELDKLSNMRKGDMTRVQEKRLEELEAMNLDDTTEISQLKNQLSNEVFALVQGDKTGRLAESYREVARRKQTFEADLSKYKGKQKEAVQRAVESGVLNNTYRSHELVNLLSKIEADKGIVFNYADNAKLKESGFALDGKTVNGFVDTNTGAVTLNIQSAKSWQSVVGHEITHVLEGTDAYDELQNALYAYAESKGELASRRSAITDLYKGMNADIDAELTADLVGDYLFSDKDFVTHLTTNRNLFQKIYDEIKYLYNVATGKEQKEIAKVKKEFDKAWKELNARPAESGQKNNTADNSGGVKYSITEPFVDNNGTNFGNTVLLDTNFFDGLSPRNWGGKLKTFVFNRSEKEPFILPIIDENGNTQILQFAKKNDRVSKNGSNEHLVLSELVKTTDNISKLSTIHIDEIIEVSEEGNPYYSEGKEHGWLDANGWLHRTANVINAKNGTIYNITIDIAKTADGRTILYATKGKIKKVGQTNVNSLKIKGSRSHSNFENSIPNSIENVKHSLSPVTDTEYLSAVESGDMALAQSFVDEAAEAAMQDSKIRDKSDKLVKVYHGSDSADFYEFDKNRRGQTDSSMYGRGYYFAFDPDYSSDFGENIREFYLDIKNPYYIDINAPASKIANFLKSKGIKVDFDYSNMKSHYFAKNFGSQRFTDTLVDLGFDGVVVRTDEGLDFEAVAFHRNQMKLADAITYDDEGNVIPISERFNTDNKDIRYSLSNEADDIGPVGNFSTPLNELYNEDIAPVREDIAPVTTNPAITDAPIRGDIAPVAEQKVEGVLQTIEQRIAENLRAVESELADNIELRKAAEDDFDEQITNLQMQYVSKKNTNTKTAYNLLQRISRLERLKKSTDANFAKRISDLEARVEKMRDPAYSRALYKQVKMQEHAKWAEALIGDTTTWVDKKLGLQYQTNTERRNLRDIVRDENGNKDIARADAISNALHGQYNREEAAKKREQARIVKKYADMKITKAESTYIQMLGELRYNPKTSLSEKDVNAFYAKHKKQINKNKVDKAIDYARKDYDSLILRLNEKLREQGMREIPYRKGYFPHFTEPKQNFIMKLLNWKTQNTEIPTSIAGLTESFRPVKKYQSFDKQRHTDATDYNFLQGFDNYLDGALDWIYHLDTLQKRRAVENYIRYVHSYTGIQERIKAVYANEELDADEAQAQVDHILAEGKNPLNNFVQDFTTRTNILAGKKNSLDRTIEQSTNRHIYSVMTNVQNRMSANMVLANIRSAMTNFIPITQSWAQVSPLESLKAAKDTIANAIKDDGMVDKSTFLTNRLREVDRLYQTNWDKVLDTAGIAFDIVDNFSSQVIWRSKYNQNIKRGMTESEAINNADQFAENVMAGRSKGNEPTLFNAKNPLVKAFTMFQLEVNNQYGYLFKDVPNDLKAETKHWKLNLAKGYTTAFVGAYVFNVLMEMITGSDAAFDPIGIIEDLLRDLGLFDEDEEKEPGEIAINLIDNVIEELPFVGGLFGGGRVPISSAMPYSDEYDEGLSGFISDVSEGEWGNVGKEMMNPILNVVLPVGGGQIKKTYQGLSMFNTDEEHPVAGSYTDKGNLRFPIEDTPINRIQAGLFGQYASENAREYFDSGYAPLNEKQIQEYVDVELPIADYWKYREGLKGLKTNAEKADYINTLDIEDWQKNLLMNNHLDREEDVDMSDYNDYSDFEEFDFAQQNPEKYDFLQANNISYAEYNADEESREAYNWAFNNPEGYAVSKAVSKNVVTYKRYTKMLNGIKAEKDENGNSISGSRKEKVIDCINNIDADWEAKIILYKKVYPSENYYNEEIINYINNREDLSYEERVAIFTELGFTVTDDTVYWD